MDGEISGMTCIAPGINYFFEDCLVLWFLMQVEPEALSDLDVPDPQGPSRSCR